MPACGVQKSQPQEAPAPRPSQQKEPEGRFPLRVDGQTKSIFATLEAAEDAARATKKAHPVAYVGVDDGLEHMSKAIQLPEGWRFAPNFLSKHRAEQPKPMRNV